MRWLMDFAPFCAPAETYIEWSFGRCFEQAQKLLLGARALAASSAVLQSCCITRSTHDGSAKQSRSESHQTHASLCYHNYKAPAALAQEVCEGKTGVLDACVVSGPATHRRACEKQMSA